LPIFTRAPALGASSSWTGYRAPLLAGDQGTQQTVELMRRLVDEALADQDFVNLAVRIVKTVPAYQDMGEVQALYRWVKQNIRFTKDPVTKEKLYPPQQLLKIKAGDCDDISMLLGAFLLALGYPARLITISANPSQPNEFSHVYAEGEVPPGSGQWIPMDAARVDSEFGVAPPNYFRKRAWSLTDNSYQDLSGSRAFVHANTVSGLGEYVRDAFVIPGGSRLSGMGSYGRVGRLGQTDPNLISQALAEMPALISVTGGGSSSSVTPYGSFMTSNTPGYGIPPAGYTAAGYPVPAVAASASASSPLLLIGGLALVAMMMMGGRSAPRSNPSHRRYKRRKK
jgi:hypothetical protein